MLNKIKQIGNFTFAFSILKAIRAKIEKNIGIENRIGQSFKDGFKGCLAVGTAGGGKTSTLKAIFKGLELDAKNDSGKTIGKWIPSGISTGVGLFELFVNNNEGIIVMDELDCGSTQHIHIMKQVASGTISRLKSKSVEPTPFSGILLGATNGLPLSKKNLPHLMAMLERFTLVNIKPQQHKEEDIFNTDQEKYGCSLTREDWIEIAERLSTRCAYNLNKEERTFGRELFIEKKKESLDPNKALYRQASEVIDILLFTKRFFHCENIMNNEELKQVVKDMVADTVHCNPIRALQLSSIEVGVYQFLEDNGGAASFCDIVENAEANGYLLTDTKLRNLLNKLVQIRVINKYRDVYSTKNINEIKNKSSILSEVL